MFREWLLTVCPAAGRRSEARLAEAMRSAASLKMRSSSRSGATGSRRAPGSADATAAGGASAVAVGPLAASAVVRRLAARGASRAR